MLQFFTQFLFPFDMIYVPSKLNVLFEDSPIKRTVNVEIGIWNCMKILSPATASAKLTFSLTQNTQFESIIQKIYFKNSFSWKLQLK